MTVIIQLLNGNYIQLGNLDPMLGALTNYHTNEDGSIDLYFSSNRVIRYQNGTWVEITPEQTDDTPDHSDALAAGTAAPEPDSDEPVGMGSSDQTAPMKHEPPKPPEELGTGELSTGEANPEQPSQPQAEESTAEQEMATNEGSSGRRKTRR